VVTAIVTSDNHLGAYYARLRPERLERRRVWLQRAFERVVDEAIRSKADLFLHAGDLFDRPDARNSDRRFVARQIRRLIEAGIPIVAIAGNHDSPRGAGYGEGPALPQDEMEALGAIHLLRATDRLESVALEVAGARVCVHGMSADFNREPGACPLEGITGEVERRGDVDIVLLHYGIEGLAPPFGDEPVLSRANLDLLPVDAICVGHLHTRAEIRLASGALLLNPGATEHIHFGDEHLECGFWQLRCHPEGNLERVAAEYVPLVPQPMRTLDIDLEELANGIQSRTAVAAAITLPPQFDGEVIVAVRDEEPPDSGSLVQQAAVDRIVAASESEQMLRVRVVGRLERSVFQALDLVALQAVGAARNFSCRAESEGLLVFDRLGEGLASSGVSFDPGEELESVAQERLRECEEGSEEWEITRGALDMLRSAYERFTGGRE
jgi:DNA repair exonuclease SbcCD nuclease subunit